MKAEVVDVEGRRRVQRYIAVAVCLVLVAGGVRVALGRLRAQPGASGVQPVPVKVVQCQEGRVERKVRLVGVLTPVHSVPLGPKTGGRLERLLVKVGDEVSKGALLALFDARELRAQVHQAEAALAAARADLARIQKGATPEELRQLEAAVSQAQAAADSARSAYERTKSLFEADLASRQQYEQAETQLRAAEAQLEQARARFDSARAGATPEVLDAAVARVRQAEAALELAQAAFSNAELRAPFSGVVCEARGEPGELVAPGAPVVVLAETDLLAVELNLPENLAGCVKAGDELAVTVSAAGGAEVKGKVKWVAPAASSQTRLFRVRVEVPNPRGELKAGMFAEVYVVERAADGPVVPQEAVVKSPAGAKVFVVAEGLAREKAVDVLVSDGSKAVVKGISAGDIVVVSGQELLRDGTPVSIVEGGN